MTFRVVVGAICFAMLIAVSEACSSSCGSLSNISYPFRLSDDPPSCGDRNFELLCHDNQTLLNLSSTMYKVLSISYSDRTIRLLYPGLETDNCTSLPNHLITNQDLEYSYFYYYDDHFITYLSCSQPNNETSTLISTSPCINSSSLGYYYVQLHSTYARDIPTNCTLLRYLPNYGLDYAQNETYMHIWSMMISGFKLSWTLPFYSQNENPYGNGFQSITCNAFQSIHCFLSNFWSALQGFGIPMLQIIGYILAGRSGVAILCLYSFIFYKLYRENKALNEKMKLFLEQFDIYNLYIRNKAQNQSIEQFLEQYRNLTPTRYSYAKIKKMSKGFKDKLGQGGFGSVYKGTLSSGQPVAIKLLGNTKGNGEEFINEVATIGRIHHENVVRLVGFCYQRNKRALVYEYMPNGSLDKHIYSKGDNVVLSLEKMYDIALGSARGIEYLHRGCDMQILHFDIKPHNILLDENFTPKVSDFGLAKLYPTEKSRVSVSAAKGTIGYIAPELIYRNFGNVSYKSDVYSFGRLLLEMIGATRKLEVEDEYSSHLYIPALLYDTILVGNENEVEVEMRPESKLGRVMVIVGLWCIQMRPDDRPSMHKVVEMLEGRSDDLPVPPRPNLAFGDDREVVVISVTDTTESLQLLDSSDSSVE